MQEKQERSDSSGSTLLKGAAILGAAAVISKLIGTLQKIPLQNIAGDEAFGIYSIVYPLYILILFLATAGFPIAVSAFVSQYTAQGNYREARRVLRLSSVVLTVTGIVCFILLFFGAQSIALLIGNKETVPAIRSVSFALLFVPLMSALRGYFQGHQNMVPTGISQVVEQIVRVATMIGLLLLFVGLGYTASRIAAGATFGSVTGAMAGLLVMGYYWLKDRRRNKYDKYDKQHVNRSDIQETDLQLMKRFIYYALPICLGSIVLPILNLVDTFTMPRILEAQGLDELGAVRQYGIYVRGLPLVQLVAMVASSLSVALVPAIAEARAKEQWGSIRVRTELTMRFTWFIGLAASVGLMIAAVPINIMLYKNDAGSLTMAILALTAVFSTLNIVSGSILQGVGAVMIPARNLMFAAIVKIVGNIVLTPLWGIQGAAAAGVLAFAAASVLNLAALRSRTGASFLRSHYIYKPGVALLCMVTVLLGLIYGIEAVLPHLPFDVPYRMGYTMVALIAVLGGAAVYFITLIRVGAVTKHDLLLVPRVHRQLNPLLKRFKI